MTQKTCVKTHGTASKCERCIIWNVPTHTVDGLTYCCEHCPVCGRKEAEHGPSKKH